MERQYTAAREDAQAAAYFRTNCPGVAIARALRAEVRHTDAGFSHAARDGPCSSGHAIKSSHSLRHETIQTTTGLDTRLLAHEMSAGKRRRGAFETDPA
jgi:hypothetical protein